MSQTNFVPRQLGIKAFPEANRIDFILEDPQNYEQPPRCSVFFNAMEAEVKLDGKRLRVLPPERDENGELIHPNRLSVRWGRQTVNLGLCGKEGVKPYYYRGLETANDAARPKTPGELFAAMGLTE